jgi:hypothetical protein
MIPSLNLMHQLDSKVQIMLPPKIFYIITKKKKTKNKKKKVFLTNSMIMEKGFLQFHVLNPNISLECVIFPCILKMYICNIC